MATRRLDGESWADALNRIERWRSGDLAVCWAMVRDTREDQWVMLGITVRGGEIVSQREFEDAFMASVGYVDGEGVVVTVGEGGKGWASGHELQALWKIQLSETSYRRAVKVVAQAGAVTFHADAEPAYFAVSLQNEEGSLVDYVERFAQVDAAAEPSQLPSDALPEAFDFLASIWRNVTGKYLFEVHRVSPAARLTAAVANRGDFQT